MEFKKGLPTFEQLLEIHEKTKVDPTIVSAYIQRVKPSWAMIERPPEGMDGAYAFRRGVIQVLVSLRWEEDHNIWIHASLCGRRSETSYFLPSQDDVKRVKNDFIGENKWAYQIFPDEANYINQNPYVLHLFALLENRPALPDFTHGLGTI